MTAITPDHTPERTAVLAELDAALHRVDRVTPLTESRYRETHQLFEDRSTQQQSIVRWFTDRLLPRLLLPGGATPRVLGVGCGSGVVDEPVIRGLLQRAGAVHYTGLDPNRAQVEAFTARFAAAPLPGARVEVVPTSFEQFSTEQRFDLVHCVHCLYYMPDAEASLRRARALLAPGGTLAVVLGPRGALNELAARFYDKGCTAPTQFAEDLAASFAAWRWPCERRRIDARVDVTPLFTAPRSATARALRDFIVQVDCSRLPDEVTALVDRYLQLVALAQDGRWFIDHPADAFCVPGRSDPAAGAS